MLCRRTEVFPDRVRRPRLPLRARRGRNIAQSGTLAGESLAAGLRESDRLDPPLLQPRHEGRDRATTRTSRSRGWRRALGAETAARAGAAEPPRLRARTRIAAERGIIIADTKFEFGRDREVTITLDRRSAHAGQLAVLAGRRLSAGPVAAELRQAAAARLSRRGTTRRPMERRRAAAGAAATRSSTRPARAISTPFAGSPALTSISTELT